MNGSDRIFITDCEGPVSKNDNAFELSSYFIPKGNTLFTQLSKYDDVLADIIKPVGYRAGDTLRLIVPFLKAYGVTDRMMTDFSSKNISLVRDARETLTHAAKKMAAFIVSTSYEHYIQALCSAIGFPYENTFCTNLRIDSYNMSEKDRKSIKRLSRDICSLPLIEIPEKARSIHDLPESDVDTIGRIDHICRKEIPRLESGAMLEDITPMGGIEKANVVRTIVRKMGRSLSDVMYVGDSITDVECFELIREGGGLTISFNGNAYAIRSAEVAVLSRSSVVTAVIADIFERQGKEYVFHLIDDWRYDQLSRFNIDPTLHESLRRVFSRRFPRVSRISDRNLKELISESSGFRKLVRGEKVGKLG
ncbi:MAG: HAD hydrolase family protein [Candidatus Bathyarchaeota archaeon]|nr:MAG: HAD hydrolase family protein [Candidatus Bathyarchaeota archaeon]